MDWTADGICTDTGTRAKRATGPRTAARSSGGAHRVGDLGRALGFIDVDGSLPEPFEIPDDL